VQSLRLHRKQGIDNIIVTKMGPALCPQNDESEAAESVSSQHKTHLCFVTARHGNGGSYCHEVTTESNITLVQRLCEPRILPGAFVVVLSPTLSFLIHHVKIDYHWTLHIVMI
jgi:hypothetical protein